MSLGKFSASSGKNSSNGIFSFVSGILAEFLQCAVGIICFLASPPHGISRSFGATARLSMPSVVMATVSSMRMPPHVGS